ncbi:unannotated protein [freshwater metagenome]|jgi:hypothetical protein|uniref:Unannotated protein n=1 Tax=freshwater metagenome TaxID=449393 RepID=A0A6J6CTA4_9ZZZZ
MSTTFWILFWSGLILASLVINLIIFKSLYNRGLAVLFQLNKVAVKSAALAEKIGLKPLVQRPESSIDKDPAIALSARRSLLKSRLKKQQQRQRRLIESLKRRKPTERRFR